MKGEFIRLDYQHWKFAYDAQNYHVKTFFRKICKSLDLRWFGIPPFCVNGPSASSFHESFEWAQLCVKQSRWSSYVSVVIEYIWL